MPSVARLEALGAQESVGLMCASGVYDTALGLGIRVHGYKFCLKHVVVIDAPIIRCRGGHLRAKERS